MSKQHDNTSYKRVYCIGIGGIGISALARYYADQGAIVSGSDTNESELIQRLRDESMPVYIGHDASHVPVDADLVIYTIAIDYENNVEYIEAKSRQGANKQGANMQSELAILSYPEALGELTKSKKTIAICGTHGKTTTTALTYYALREAGLSPTLIVGSLIDHAGQKTNYIKGDKEKNGDEYLIIEACEYRRSFLNYHPTYILVTNIDEDHLDYYRDINDIKDAFREFAYRLPLRGKVIIHEAEKSVFITDAQTKNKMQIAEEIADIDEIKLTVIGEHNKSNAQLVIALAHILTRENLSQIVEQNLHTQSVKNIFIDKVKAGLKKFLGTWRRMEYRGYGPNGAIIYDDYAHHPIEIRATLNALHAHYVDHKIVVAFQPHLQSRTAAFYDDFVLALSIADIVYVLPVYHARAEADLGMSNYKLVASIIDLARSEGKYKEVYTLDFVHAHKELAKYDKNHIVITMGAGQNNVIADELVKEI